MTGSPLVPQRPHFCLCSSFQHPLSIEVSADRTSHAHALFRWLEHQTRQESSRRERVASQDKRTAQKQSGGGAAAPKHHGISQLHIACPLPL